MKIVIDVHDAETAEAARDWLHEATENFDISYDYLGGVLPQFDALVPYITGEK